MSKAKKILLWFALALCGLFFIASFSNIVLFIIFRGPTTIQPGVQFFVLVISGLLIGKIQKKLELKKKTVTLIVAGIMIIIAQFFLRLFL